MPDQRTPWRWSYGGPGIDQRLTPLQPSMHGFFEAHNGYFTSIGSFVTRPGNAYLGAAIGGDADVDGAFDFWINNTTQWTIKISNGVFYKLVSLTWTPVALGTVAVTAGLPVNFSGLANSAGNPVVVFGNGTDHNGMFDGTTITDLSAQLVPCKYFSTHGTRIFAAGNPANPSRLFWCKDSDASDWTAASDAGFKDVEKGNDIILGVASHGEDLYVTKGDKQGSLHRLTGLTYATFEMKNVMRGFTGYHRTMISTGNDLLLQSKHGISSLNRLIATSGDLTRARISGPVQAEFDGLPEATIHKGCAVWYEHLQIAVFVMSFGGTHLDKVFCAAVPSELGGDYRWSLWDIPLSTIMTTFTQSSQQVLLTGRAGGRMVASTVTGTDEDGSMFHNHIVPTFLYGDSNRHMKVAKHFTLTYRSAGGIQLDLELFRGPTLSKPIQTGDGGLWEASPPVWDTSGVWTDAAVNTTNTPLRGISTAFRPKLSRTAGTMEVFDSELEVVPMGRAE